MELSCPLRIQALSRKYTDHALVFFSHIINPLLTKLARSKWLDIGLVLFLRVYGPHLISVHKHAKKELGQYPAILTSRLINNPYINDRHLSTYPMSRCRKDVVRQCLMSETYLQLSKWFDFRILEKRQCTLFSISFLCYVTLSFLTVPSPKLIHFPKLQTG